ncbi:hypothetical protein AVP42_00315 [Agromyces sp. NDB4Y10]|uniref:hypothetical protein n=1 Tax=Agromyces sp. NDB4Y10 TaxID=1775951 RepID=UPI0007B220DE|nr:hypothetical protein [Agromyces sp. NDB4Y10]KZE95555.1 hypothetical protein AVP42_00315 [Agromyces sp. NDB4Y10]
MPTTAMFFLAFWWGMVGIGSAAVRAWLVDRLRIINGGVESSRLRVGKRIADVLILFMFATAAFWLAMALVGFATSGPS